MKNGFCTQSLHQRQCYHRHNVKIDANADVKVDFDDKCEWIFGDILFVSFSLEPSTIDFFQITQMEVTT